MLLYCLYGILLSFGQGFISSADTTVLLPGVKKYFVDCQAEGSIVVYNSTNNTWYVSDTTDIRKETLPASTFKIINLLIALETKTIRDENEIIKWPGKTDTVKYGYRPEIYKDMTVKEAFELSAGWAFIELAKKIGKTNYRHYLKACNYGNLNLAQEDPDFWNYGPFGISVMNQVSFVKDLYYNRLPFSKRNTDIVKRVMLSETTDNYTIRAKTGWTRESGINTGWWVGYVETRKGVAFFATRLLQDRKNNQPTFGACRKNISKAVLSDLNIIDVKPTV